MAIGALVDVDVERILPGGTGLGYARGRTVLIALAAPGDQVLARIESLRGGVAFASITEIKTPSPVRVTPPCPYFGRCGGCDFQQLSYEAQLAAKTEIIRDCLHRIARINATPDISITGSPSAWHYRSRAEWQHDRKSESFGYFERGSHKVCDVVECPVIASPLQERLSVLREERHALPKDVFEFQAVAGDEREVALAPPVINEDTRTVARNIGGERYLFDAHCFFQINHELLSSLIAEAVKGAEGETALDLYCGVGLFTLPLARRLRRVIGVESNATATQYAQINLANAGLTNAAIETAKVSEWLVKNAEALPLVDFLLLDPPRAGTEAEALRAITKILPRRIVYVSCDPATLARDLKILVTDGAYRLDSVAAFDMFPQTHHVETVAHLTRAA